MYYSRKPLWGEINSEGALFFNTFSYYMNSRYFNLSYTAVKIFYHKVHTFCEGHRNLTNFK